MCGWDEKVDTTDTNIAALWDAQYDLANDKHISKSEKKWSVVYGFLTVARGGGISVNSGELKSFFSSWDTAVQNKNYDEVAKYEKVFEVSSAAN